MPAVLPNVAAKECDEFNFCIDHATVFLILES